MNASDRGPLAALLGIALVWGIAFVVMKQALEDASVLLLLAIRFTVATFSLWVAMRIRGAIGWSRRALVSGSIAGTILFLAYAFQTAGLTLTTPAKSAFVTGLFVVLVPFLSFVVFQIRLQRWELAGALISVTGLALLTLRPENWLPGMGDLLTLGGALAFAGHMVMLGKISSQSGAGVLALAQIGSVAVWSWAACPVLETPMVRFTPQLIGAVLMTGVLCTALAFLVQTWAQRRLAPSRAALAMATEPVFAAITSYWAYGERFSGLGYVGGALILAGILVVEVKPQPRVWHHS